MIIRDTVRNKKKSDEISKVRLMMSSELVCFRLHYCSKHHQHELRNISVLNNAERGTVRSKIAEKGWCKK